MIRLSARKNSETRIIKFQKDINIHAEGSCLVSFGNTKVICTASVENKTPKFLQYKNHGWVTAQYSMLPRATHQRNNRESNTGKLSGRTQEIQRLIGRSLRSAIDLELLGKNQIIIDCDVIQADGGTRSAAISGGYVALELAVKYMLREKLIIKNPIKSQIAAISCGLFNNEILLDLDYNEDSNIDVDANIVMNSNNEIIEIQATSEKNCFSNDQLIQMLKICQSGCSNIFNLQKEFIANI